MPYREVHPDLFACEATPLPFEPAGVFWLDPHAIQEVDSLINETQLPTMSLGAETHADEMPTAKRELADILIPDDDPLTAELERALDIGFMYGGLLADKTLATYPASDDMPENSAPDTPAGKPLPEILRESLRAAAEGLDPNEDNDSHLLFMRLRNAEVQYAHSDILAFSLASTQDHMRQQFIAYHKSEKTLTAAETRRLQTMYYAGALTGALMSSDARNLGKPPVEIMRQMQGRAESIALRLEFEPDDDPMDVLDNALSSKLAFSYLSPVDEEPYIAVIANGFQFGPNTISQPLFIPGVEEPALMKKIPLAEVEALIVSDIDPKTAERNGFRLLKDPGQYEPLGIGTQITGVLLDGGNTLVAAYDPAHPNALVIKGLVSKAYGADRRSPAYSSGIEVAGSEEAPLISRGLGRAAIGAGLVMPWALDALTELTEAGRARWDQDLIADGVILAGYALYKGARQRLQRKAARSDESYQQLLDQITGQM